MSTRVRSSRPTAARLAFAALALLAALPSSARETALATLDLTTEAGLAAVRGEWRVADAALVPVEFFAPGANGQPGSERSTSFDLVPRAGEAGFDASGWPRVAPGELSKRRGGGKLSFVWYRLRLTLPETVAGRAVAGSTVAFETVIDDAAEVWVDGELRRCPGQRGGSMLAGWNAPNRVVVARAAVPGRTLELAVLGVNGPLSGSPTNYVWMRSARLSFHPPAEDAGGPVALSPACEENITVERLDARLDTLISRNPKLFLLAEGFTFTEGPVWSPANGGELLFSEPNANRIWKWTPKEGLAVFREHSGYDGADIARYRQPGSNGLAIDAAGRLTLAEHGRRRVSRLESDGRASVLAAHEAGKRLNSPNDLVYKSDGSLYFTDPFFGLPELARDPAKELPHQGVYRLRGGTVELLVSDLAGPNGIAFSPDERTLYVGDWDDAHKAVMRYPVLADGRLGAGETFVDLTNEKGEDAIDGVKTDEAGNVYISGPGGLWIVAADGTRLGRIRTPRHVHNFAWGEDGSVLYLAARDHLYRLPLTTRGFAPHLAPPPRILRRDRRFDTLVPRHATPERLARGFHWLEGPAWSEAEGALYFSDIPANTVFRLRPGEAPQPAIMPSGYSGGAPFRGREPGANGLVFDSTGALLLCQHGDRRVARREADGRLTTVAERFEGRRLNSPNDVLALADGEVWFTDPPFGLPLAFDDPAKELPFQGVYRVTAGGELRLLTSAVRAPNGLALSPDGRTLYVSNAEAGEAAVVYAFTVGPDRTLSHQRVFASFAAESRAGAKGAPDGLEVDTAGNVWIAGPGGVHVFSPRGRRLGTIAFERATANLELAGDGHLYITADTAIWRLPVHSRRARP